MYNDSIIGVYGMGVMGQSIAMNMANHGYDISVFNKDEENTRRFMENAKGKTNIQPTYSLAAFVASLQTPRKIFLMLTAGPAIDQVIEGLLPMLSAGDIIIDGGNTYFKDTIRREKYLKKKGIFFIGAGVSGGEKGALEGPSIMPSGDLEAYKKVENLLVDISAKTRDDSPCCTYIGPNGSGHFVKMVHNGIEYADIQLLCDVYQVMRVLGGMDIHEIKAVFESWNRGRLSSYLVEITSEILGVVDEETGKPLLDMILDRAGQKGTGKWTSHEALDMCVPIPSIADSVFMRYLSARKEERLAGAEIFGQRDRQPIEDKQGFIQKLEEALYVAKICAYAQGFQLLQVASDEYGWNLDLGEISLIWREGCIIRAEFLNEIKKVYTVESGITNLMHAGHFSKILKQAEQGLRDICVLAIQNGIAVSGLTSTISYFDACKTATSSANLLQALRDFFGAHTYERVDKRGHFHTVWE